MATGQEIADRIKRRLARTRATGIDDTILEELKQAQTDLENGATMPWFLLQRFEQVTPQAADTELLTELPPTDFLRLYQDLGVFMIDSDGKRQPCVREDYDMWIQKTSSTSFSTPWYTVLDAGQIFVRPAPTVTRTFGMWYYRRDTTLTLGTDNDFTVELTGLILSMAGEAVALGIESPRTPWFTQQIPIHRKAFIARNTAMEEANRERIMGD